MVPENRSIDLTEAEIALVTACLKTFYDISDDPEMETISGYNSEEIKQALEDYITNPTPLLTSTKTYAVIENIIGQFLSYPFSKDPWSDYSKATRSDVRKLDHKLNGRVCGPDIFDIPSLLNYIERGNKPSYIFFWGHQPKANGDISKSSLSQWYPSYFLLDNQIYPTAEHYMMAEKARLFEDKETLDKILKATSPSEAKNLGREVRGFNETLWASKRFEILVKGNKAKFSQNTSFNLGWTNGSILVEASPLDPIYGIGLSADHPDATNPHRWKGLNLLGFALMKAREELR